MTSAQICILIAIVAYLLVVVGIGVVFAKKSNTVDDFYLGGRKLGPLVTAMSAEASDMSSWLLMGLPGLAYISGVADAAWTAIGLAAGTYVNWLIVAKRIRRYTKVAGDSTTLPEFFSKRYRDQKNILNCIAALVIIIFFVPYTASGFAACGKLFSSLFGMNYMSAMLMSAVVIVVYTALGGFLAASTSDFIQSIIMTIALVIILGFGIHTAGGFDAVMENAKGLSGYLSFTQTHSAGAAKPYGVLNMFSMLAWGLGYFGMPHILLRFMAIEDEKKLTLSRRVASIWVVISLMAAVFIGIVGNAMSANQSIETFKDTSTSETIIVRIADLISQHGILAALVAGVILAGILAATMSTADSQLLAASSSVSKNIMKDFLKLNFTEKQGMIAARVTVVVISVVAVLIARDENSSVFNIVSFAWAGFGAAFGPLVLLALFWRRSNQYGAFAGMIVGGVMVLDRKSVV